MERAQHSEVLTQLKTFIRKENKQEAPILTELVDYYFVAISHDELALQPISELYAKFYSHFMFMQRRQDGQVKLRVFNPTMQNEGFISKHTVIQLNQDDMPFLVDSLLMELNRRNVNIHYIVHNGAIPVERNAKGEIIAINEQKNTNTVIEANVYIEVDRQVTEADLMVLQDQLFAVLSDVGLAVEDFPQMRGIMAQLAAHMSSQEPRVFLEWLCDNQFTFLGYVAYHKKNKSFLRDPGTALGLMKDQSTFGVGSFDEEFRHFPASFTHEVLVVCKSERKSTVHRSAYMDAILVRELNAAGEVEIEHRFLGLYTSRAYHLPSRDTPLLREKVERVYKRADFAQGGHDIKALEDIIESFPKDELFQMTEDELYQTAMNVLYIQERQQIRLFVRRDIFGRFFNVMVYLPRDLYNTKLRQKLEFILMQELHGMSSSFSPHFLQSVLCRVDFIIRVKDQAISDINIERIEERLRNAARNWNDDLFAFLIEQKGEHEGGKVFHRYSQAFPNNYQEDFVPGAAIKEIAHIEMLLASQQDITISFEQDTDDAKILHLKILQCHQGVWLTHILPMLENFGLQVIEERPYEISLPDNLSIWLSDFIIVNSGFRGEFSLIQERFKEALSAVWNKHAENDGFNRLTMLLSLSVREVVLLRAIGKYLIQIGFTYSQQYFEDTLAAYPELTRALVDIFFIKFDPARKSRKEIDDRYAEFSTGLKNVQSLDHDRILRKYRDVVKAMLRTNYFQKNADGQLKSCVSFKLNPELIPDLPKPIPFAEIFVYAPEVEGVHLRGSKVSRGGIRWSDRREDFRTEVLGLMKAQQVKNAVIVPLGAKGGFYPKHLASCEGREAIQNEAIACYKIYISALLDITDNIVDAKVIPPKDVVRYDEDDPYFVVAADKGTATFSDIANSISEEYNFWLGDAFASGGSNGYDHKKMGITAKGAWESVKRHFFFLSKNIQKEDFTCVGVGDMSGDVFGNGMLLSKHTRLVAAFNHMHIFLDPNPDAATSFKERERLFRLPRSGWNDYKVELISKGGGVFARSLKVIPISPEVKSALGIEENELEPNQLIKAILKSPVELLWNGGIGTYVKASTQNNMDVGDRTNDPLRVNANDLRCKVVGEGGNLGFTQLARVEYALLGGQICTDAIDNSAGVDCSDHEVNIKILLNAVMQEGKITLETRNTILAEMRDEVGELVLSDNYHQTQAISNGVSRVTAVSTYIRLLRELEREGFINRELEALPSDKILKARASEAKGFTKPEFSVLMAYAKNTIKKILLESDLPEEPFFNRYLAAEFPQVLFERFPHEMNQHRLRREIIVTQITNVLIQYSGIAYVHRMYDEVGATPDMSVRAFVIAIKLFNIEEIWQEIESLDGKINAEVQVNLMNEISAFLEHQCRWLIRHFRGDLRVAETIDLLAPDCQVIIGLIRQFLNSGQMAFRRELVSKYTHQGIPKAMAEKMADFHYIYSALDVINTARAHNVKIDQVLEVGYALSQEWGLSWLRQKLNEAAREGYWEMLTASSLKDDLNRYQANLAVNILERTDEKPALKRIEEWSKRYSYVVRRWHILLEDFKLSPQEFVRMVSLLNSLRDLMELSER